MEDPRLKHYREAALAMAEGDYRPELDPGPGPADGVGRLGEALDHLARTLDQRLGERLTLPRVVERINAGLLPAEVMDRAYRSLRTLVPFDRLDLALLDRDGRALTVRWVRSEAPRVLLAAGWWCPMQASGLADVVASGLPRIHNDLPGLLAAEAKAGALGLLAAEGMQAHLACPLVVRNRAVGLLGFASMAAGAYRRSHQVLLGQLAGPLAQVVEKSRLHQDLQERAELRGRLLAAAGAALGAPLDAVLAGLEAPDRDGAPDPAGRVRARRALADLRARLGTLREAAELAWDDRPWDLAALPVAPLVAGAVRSLREAAAERSIRLDLEGAAGEAWVRGEPRRLTLVVATLAGYLLGRLEPGGRLELAWRALDHHVRFRIGAPGLDLGPGPELVLPAGGGPPAAPDPDATALILARRLVEAHQGHLQVERGPEPGLRFTLWLPCGSPVPS